MRIAVLGHSLVHVRQQAFFKEVARLGHDVLMLCPDAWGTLRAKSESWPQSDVAGNYELCPLPAFGAPDMYRYGLQGVRRELERFKPDVLYIQQEVDCWMTKYAVGEALAFKTPIPVAVFVWENIKAPSPEGLQVLNQVELLVCGNADAARLHPAREKCFLPQVGVDTDHFQARPDVERDISVGFIGRPVPEKGINQLMAAWPTAKITPWTDWAKMPWLMSTVKVVVAFSQDTLAWHEQAMPYVAAEAMATGCAVVTSDAGSIPFWHRKYAPHDEPSPAFLPYAGDIDALRKSIDTALNGWEVFGNQGREWVVKHLSSPVIARKLVAALGQMVH